VGAVEVAQRLGQLVEGVVVVEAAGQELDRVAQPRPGRLAELRAGALLRCSPGERLEVAVAPVAPREPEQDEPGRQQPPVGQVVDGRDQLLLGEVAGDPEHDEHARVGDPGEPAVTG
jgi:hypothetical protein